MTLIGYHASHEQHPPSRLLACAVRAEEAGFAAVSSSDHFTPWSSRQGESGFAWSWLGAAMQATTVPFGVVNAPGQRYHPAIIAQAIATLGEMFPGRLWVALGSGEASNEHITGERWPPKPERNARLLACVEVIRALLQGEEVSTDGPVRVDRARLWTLPASRRPHRRGPQRGDRPVVRVVGRRPDHRAHAARAAGPVIDAFREGGGEGKPVRVQVKVAWAPTEDEALAGAHDQWRTNVFDSVLMADLETVEQFEVAATHVRPDDVRASVLVSADLGQHLAWLHETLDAGADELFVHQVPRDQDGFLDVFGAEVLPEVAGR